jgi:hypothetical protein
MFTVSQANGRSKRSTNYMGTKEIVLVKGWKSVSLDAVTGNDQTVNKHWQKIGDKFHHSCR